MEKTKSLRRKSQKLKLNKRNYYIDSLFQSFLSFDKNWDTSLYLNHIKMALDFAAGCAGGAIIEKYFLINNFLPQVVLEYWLVIL